MTQFDSDYNNMPTTTLSFIDMQKQKQAVIQNTNIGNFKNMNQLPSCTPNNLRDTSHKIETTFSNERSKVSKLVDNGQDFGQVIPLAYYQTNQEVHIQEETLYMLQKFSLNETCFLGFMGSDDSCRSFILDTIINLSSIQGNHFTRVYECNDTPGIFIWSLPYSHNTKLKTFILECRGIKFENQQLSRRDQILIDLLIVLCSSIILVGTPFQYLPKKIPIFKNQSLGGSYQMALIRQLILSKDRINFLGQPSCKQNFYWPHSFYYFYPEKNSTKRFQNIQQLFHHSVCLHLEDPFQQESQTQRDLLLSLNDNLKIVNPNFVKRITQFFIEQILSTYCKQIEGLKWNGNVVCKLLINTVKYMNKKNKIKLDKVLNSIAKQLYEASFAYHCQIYENQLKQNLEDEKPFTFDALLEIFRVVENFTLTSFNEVVISQLTHINYQQKLLDFIKQKQKILIQINVKKTKSRLKQKIKELNSNANFQIQTMSNYVASLSQIGKELDHQSSSILSATMINYRSNFQKRTLEEKLKVQKYIISRLKQNYKQLAQTYQQQKQQNEQLRKENKENQKNYKKMVKQLSQLEARMKATKKEIDNQKKYQKQYIINKELKKNEAERLLQLIRQQQEKVRDNIRLMDQINKQFDYHPQILNLNKQIQQKERKNKELEKLQSKTEYMSRLSALPSQAHIQRPNNVASSKKIRKVVTRK